MYGEIIIVDDVVCVCLWIYIQGRGDKSRKYIRFILYESVKLDFPNNV